MNKEKQAFEDEARKHAAVDTKLDWGGIITAVDIEKECLTIERSGRVIIRYVRSPESSFYTTMPPVAWPTIGEKVYAGEGYIWYDGGRKCLACSGTDA